MTDQPAEFTVFYDGSCPLCGAEIGLYRSCSGADRVAFVDVSVIGAGAVAPGLDKTAALKQFHVRVADTHRVPGFPLTHRGAIDRIAAR